PAEPRTPASPEEPPPAPAARGSKRYLGLPGWGIGLIIAGIVLLCCLCVAGLCLSGPVFHRIGRERSRAVVSVTRCDITPAGGVARLEYRLHNGSRQTRSYLLDLEVTDGSGARIGQSRTAVTDVGPGETVRGEGVVMLSMPGGATCKASVAR